MAPRFNLEQVDGCTHLCLIKPDQLAGEPKGWDKLLASELKDILARYIEI